MDFIKMKLAASIKKVMMVYPRYRENIYLLAYYPSLYSFTTNDGIANPIPEPIMLAPTIMDVANALYIMHALHSEERTNM